LTALGVDYVESNCSKLPLLSRLLNAGTGSANGSGNEGGSEAPHNAEEMFISGPGDTLAEEFGDSE
jgi:hypothetical protein